MSQSFERLKHLFRNVAALSTASVFAGAAACGGPTDNDDGGGTGEISRDGFSLNVCDRNVYKPLEGLTPTQSVDFMEIRKRFDNSALASRGTACGAASNAPACTDALARSNPGVESSPPPGQTPDQEPRWRRYLVATRGDEVMTVSSLEALAGFLAPIDNAKDAALLANQRDYAFDCTRPNARQTPDGWELIARTGSGCGEGNEIREHRIAVTTSGAVADRESVVVERGDPGSCAIGRRPEGFVPRALAAADATGGTIVSGTEAEASLGAEFAAMAELEAASVFAFERLADELASHGAPAALVAEARRSAWDEVAHTGMMKDLAEHFGSQAAVSWPTMSAAGTSGARDLFAIAVENAVEGCVRETFGALQATHQALHAVHPFVVSVMRTIAEDETRHAALAWDVAAWIEPHLSTDQRNAVCAARKHAIQTLRAELATAQAPTAVTLAGAPDQAETQRMIDALCTELWAA